ncbi:MAG: ferrous iron transport protein B [Smithellaceae bacterium]
MTRSQENLIALVGQPNSGKSTVFNALTGARQHVANWPGVTVDRKSGKMSLDGRTVTVVDLPGAYGLTASSPEERVTRDFLLSGQAKCVINVLNAASLTQGLSLTLEIREMGIALIANLNMMDQAKARGLTIDTAALEKHLGSGVVPTAMNRSHGKKTLQKAVSEQLASSANGSPLRIDYGQMEPYLGALEKRLAGMLPDPAAFPVRFAAVKLMAGNPDDLEVIGRRLEHFDALVELAEINRAAFERESGLAPAVHIALCRRKAAAEIVDSCVISHRLAATTPSERIDRVVCHPLIGPVLLMGIIFLLYYLSIVQGYRLTEYTWPLLAQLRQGVEGLLPVAGFIEAPLVTGFFLWLIDSVNALLNYVPIFFILFALIAVLEDTGYMPRMAFIMDRALHRFGLHGQSVLPMVLGGVYVGGCAVPAVMACKGIPDERSRLATILTVPMLNCMAKVPLYILLVNAYFAAHKGWVMFFISSISLLVVLPVAKLLSLTVLKHKETAPFVMTLPDYHIPTLRGVLGKAIERVWLFLKKITTIVAAVAAVIFILLQLPGPGDTQMARYEAEKRTMLADFSRAVSDTRYAGIAASEKSTLALILYAQAYRKDRMLARSEAAQTAVNERYEMIHPDFFTVVRPQADPAGQKAARALRTLMRKRDGLLLDVRRNRLENSFLGRLGKAMEPVTALAGFDWRINVALLGSLAAKESAVATLGAIFSPDEKNGSLEARMASPETGMTPLHAAALIIFMVFFPPCVAAAIAVKIQAASTGFMLLAIGFPAVLGLAAAMLIFTGGQTLGLSGLGALAAFYAIALGVTILAGLVRPRSEHITQKGG